LLKNTDFILSVLALTGIIFGATGITFWIENYNENVLNVNKTLGSTITAIVTFTGPVSGVVIGGIVCDKFGGYDDWRAQRLVLPIALAAAIFTIPTPLVDSLWCFMTGIWLLLFLGGWLLPSITGMMLNDVEENLRGSANSIS